MSSDPCVSLSVARRARLGENYNVVFRISNDHNLLFSESGSARRDSRFPPRYQSFSWNYFPFSSYSTLRKPQTRQLMDMLGVRLRVLCLRFRLDARAQISHSSELFNTFSSLIVNFTAQRPP